MNKFVFYLIVGIVLILSALSLYVSLTRPTLIDRKTYNASFMVNSSAGFDLNTSTITFGRVQPGGSATRVVTVQNLEAYPVTVVVSSSDSLSDLLVLSSYSFLVAAHEQLELPLTLRIPRTTSFGSYNGTITISTSKNRRL